MQPMPINASLSEFSDVFFRASFTVYVLAAILLSVQYLWARPQVAASAAELAKVGGAPDNPRLAAPGVPGRVMDVPRTSLPDRLGNMGFAVLHVGVALELMAIVLRGFATHRFPLGNLYEFVTMATTVAMAVGLILLRAAKFRALWVYLLAPVLILMFLAATVLYATAGPVVPALKSYWLPIHVTIISSASGIFMVSGVASLLFLLRLRQAEGNESANWIGALARPLPGAQVLDRVAYKTTVIAFPLFGTGVILGAIWAEAAWGRFWGWDPKETAAFITWVIYAAYLHARATSGWRDSKAAWINVAGFIAVLFNLFIINFVVSGLHSYAGLN
jgi:cytochrome c-type biogenesis protein CcsB